MVLSHFRRKLFVGLQLKVNSIANFKSHIDRCWSAINFILFCDWAKLFLKNSRMSSLVVKIESTASTFVVPRI